MCIYCPLVGDTYAIHIILALYPAHTMQPQTINNGFHGTPVSYECHPITSVYIPLPLQLACFPNMWFACAGGL